MRTRRILVALIGLLFAALGLHFWLAPGAAALRFHLAAVGTAGYTTLRADLGGLFVALGVLCLAGAWMRRRALLLSAALVLAAIVLGRTIALVAAGGAADVPAFAIELGAIAALWFYARGLRIPADGASKPVGRRALLIGASASFVIVGLIAAGLDHRVETALFDSAARRLVALNPALLADDALRVVICGTSGPPPSPHRAKACVAVFAGGKFYVVDVGPESVENLVLWGVPLGDIGGVLLTHFHSDHIGDLGELNLQTWVQGRPAPLAVYGGPGIEQVVDGFNQAYRLDQGYRTEHHTAKLMPPETWPLVAHRVEPAGERAPRTAIVMDDGALRITAIEVGHGPVHPAYAYRFDYKGRSVVVTGDMEPFPPLAEAAAGADVLVSEALARPMIKTLEASSAAGGRERIAALMHDIQGYHISPLEVAEIANRAQVRLLVLYHLLPAPDNPIARRLFGHGVADARKGDWEIAEDGSLYTLPLGSVDIHIGEVAAPQ
ncbi:MAG TPA: MBL fold metallo-hydrolase [Steroidobacteraceae bacterium]|jgi:ribonuclease Z